MMTYLEINKKLQDKKNWSPELLYVHITRLLLGFILGVFVGILIGTR